jgi:hypothetical protein
MCVFLVPSTLRYNGNPPSLLMLYTCLLAERFRRLFHDMMWHQDVDRRKARWVSEVCVGRFEDGVRAITKRCNVSTLADVVSKVQGSGRESDAAGMVPRSALL